MLLSNFSLLFFLKKSKSCKNLKRYVYARITVDGIPAEFSTSQVWWANRWDQGIGRANDNKQDARSLNEYLDILSAKITQVRNSLLSLGEDVTGDKILSQVLNRKRQKKFILSIYKDHLEMMDALRDKDYEGSTIQKHTTTRDHVAAFIKWKYEEDDLEVNKINFEFIHDFSIWLKSKRDCNQNTTSKYLSIFKQLIIVIQKKKWIKDDPFADFPLDWEEVHTTYLEDHELSAIEQKEFTIERIALVRDIFLFSCYTGLAYVEAFRLKKSNVVKAFDKKDWIVITRKKTKKYNAVSRVPLLPEALAIIEKYKEHPRCKEQGFMLPIFSNQKMNSYLKEIGDLCGIDKELTFHVARHTFATTVTLANGVPIETLSKMMGHKSIKYTQRYGRIIDAKISGDMKRLKGKLKKRNYILSKK